MRKIFCLTFILTTLMTMVFNTNAQAAVEQPISFQQDDSKWGSKSYSITGSRSQTIGTSGCGPTAMAMAVNYYVDETITPPDMATYSLKNGCRTNSNGTSWGFFSKIAKKYDLEFLQTASSVEALKWMNTKEDPLVICSMGRGLWTNYGHYILLWDVRDGVAYINDPASTKKNRTENSYKYMASQCKQFFCFNKKPLPKEETSNLEVACTEQKISEITVPKVQMFTPIEEGTILDKFVKVCPLLTFKKN